MSVAVAIALGLLAWTFVEYLIHGILSHRYRTFVTPLHGAHHTDPRAVFTSPVASVPVTLLFFGAGALLFGATLSAAFCAGLVAGFARYEYVHWRIHFRAPLGDRQRRLRDHHLAHHFRDARAYHGVTTRVWDRVFGTLPPHWREDYARVADRPPLGGPSNLRATWSPRLVAARVRELRAAAREDAA